MRGGGGRPSEGHVRGILRSAARLARTWLSLHMSWFGHEVAALPLMSTKLCGVMAALKARGYRSAANSALRAKEMRIIAGHSLSDMLALALRHSVASAIRSQAPSAELGRRGSPPGCRSKAP